MVDAGGNLKPKEGGVQKYILIILLLILPNEPVGKVLLTSETDVFGGHLTLPRHEIVDWCAFYEVTFFCISPKYLLGDFSYSLNVCLGDGPSFDCKKAKTCIEKLICANRELSGLDKKMTEAYRNLISKLQGEDKEQAKQNQMKWIKARDERCEAVKK